MAKLSLEKPDELVSRYNARVQTLGHEVLKPIKEEQAALWIKTAQNYLGRKKNTKIGENEAPSP